MNTINNRTNVGECALDIIKDISINYRLDWYKTSSGILIYNSTGAEYWIIKLNKNGRAIRKLLHQNHGRTGIGKLETLPCNVEEINNALIQQCFHNQRLTETDPRKTLKYIYNHGNARKKLEFKRRLLLQSAFS